MINVGPKSVSELPALGCAQSQLLCRFRFVEGVEGEKLEGLEHPLRWLHYMVYFSEI